MSDIIAVKENQCFRTLTKLACCLLISFFLHTQCAMGQGVSSSGGGSSRIDSGFSFVPVPYLSYNRSIGLSFGALPMAMYNLSKKDTVSPSSISGILAMYTTNDSWVLLLFNRWYLSEDRWRIVAAAGRANINFQFFFADPISDFIDYNTAARFAKFEVQRKIVGRWYLGANYTYTAYDNTFELQYPITTEAELHGLGGVLSFDQRDNVYYPKSGQISNINYSSYPEFMGNQFVSQRIELDHNRYQSVRRDIDVLAFRFYGGFGIGDLAFNQQFIVGNSDIRGYTQGEYRGDQMVALQGEYRWNFYKKMTAVGFAGLATVFEAINEEQNGTLLPGIGVGYRYMVFPENNMNVGLDAAVGKNDWGVYFRIGEAF